MRATHTSKWLLTVLAVALCAVAGPTAAWAEDRAAPTLESPC